MAPETDIEHTASPDFFAALADSNRMAILAQLACCGPETMTVGQVAECCPIDLSVVSRHLAKLRDAGLVRAERRGREVHYCCCSAEVAGTLRALADAIETCCPRDGEANASAVSE